MAKKRPGKANRTQPKPAPQVISITSTLSPEATHALTRQSSYLNLSLIIGGAAGLLFFIYTYLIRHVSPVPITGKVSMSVPALAVAGLMIFVVFWVAFNRADDRRLNRGRLGRIFNSAALSLATAILGTSALAVFVVTMSDAFKGLMFDIVTASFMVAGAFAAVAYVTINYAVSITVTRVYVMLALILYGGILVSAIAVDTPDWYNVYLSALGMTSAGNVAKLFNFALVFAGIMLIALGNVLLRSVGDFYTNHPSVGKRRLQITHGLFIAAGISLAGIGLFPFVPDTTQGLLHQISAGLVGAIFVFWMWLLRFIIPIFNNSFYNFSIATGTGIAAVFFLSSAGIYFNTTGLELTVFVIATTWLSLYLGNMVNATLTSKTSSVS